ncbi:MAG: hypothetical protein WD533_06490 [Dehalococcoidia bacterium]
MQKQVPYKGITERKTLISQQERAGLRLLHDDYEPSWKQGEEPRGVMTWTDEPPDTSEQEAREAEEQAALETLSQPVAAKTAGLLDQLLKARALPGVTDEERAAIVDGLTPELVTLSSRGKYRPVEG